MLKEKKEYSPSSKGPKYVYLDKFIRRKQTVDSKLFEFEKEIKTLRESARRTHISIILIGIGVILIGLSVIIN